MNNCAGDGPPPDQPNHGTHSNPFQLQKEGAMFFSAQGQRAGTGRCGPQVSRFRLVRMVGRRQLQLLCGAALIVLNSPALAQNINTLPAWNGTSSISSWGVTNTATYGQTITSVPGQTILNSFTFELGQLSGTAPQYQAYVYQWNSATNRIVGAPLYASAAMTAPSGAAFTAVTINTGSIVLTPGQQYVLFLNTSNQAAGDRNLQVWSYHEHHRLSCRPIRFPEQRREFRQLEHYELEHDCR